MMFQWTEYEKLERIPDGLKGNMGWVVFLVNTIKGNTLVVCKWNGGWRDAYGDPPVGVAKKFMVIGAQPG